MLAPQLPPAVRLGRLVHRHVVFPLLDFVLPAACFACGRPLGLRQRVGACAPCWAGLRILRPPLCPLCALPRPAGTDLLGPARGRCARCVLEPPAPDAMLAVAAYEGLARRLVLRAKIGRRPELLPPLAEQLARRLTLERFAEGCTLVAAVPSHPWSDLLRGFSPARELARPIARSLGLPFSARCMRRRLTGRRAIKRMSARERRRALDGAFVVRRSLAAERILLVDDVVTSGASAAACTLALRQAGALEVRVAAWARTLPPADGAREV